MRFKSETQYIGLEREVKKVTITVPKKEFTEGMPFLPQKVAEKYLEEKLVRNGWKVPHQIRNSTPVYKETTADDKHLKYQITIERFTKPQ